MDLRLTIRVGSILHVLERVKRNHRLLGKHQNRAFPAVVDYAKCDEVIHLTVRVNTLKVATSKQPHRNDAYQVPVYLLLLPIVALVTITVLERRLLVRVGASKNVRRSIITSLVAIINGHQ